MKRNIAATIQLDRLKVKGYAGMKDLSLSALARELGISHAFLHDIIRNRRSADDYAERMAQILGVPLEQLCLKADSEANSEADSGKAA